AFDRTDRGFGVRMTERIREIPADADFILIIAGHNDATMADTDEKFASFTDSLHCLCARLKENHPRARIGFATPWAVDRENFPEVIDAIKTIAGRYGFPVLDMAYTSGIRVNDPEFRAIYFQDKGVNDTAHLNNEGHDLLVDYGTAFILLLASQP
ncbi:MAG: SGNH/GDSL hydrolase family protein, partial [Muribaculaceae bacterium]|nr:SGNH/GDSL hydrolase family protein [Muribaculaceae bacterium]